jgi:hypothetical protein
MDRARRQPFSRRWSFPFIFAGSFLSSVGRIVYFIAQVSLRQSITLNHLLGRVNSSNRFIPQGLMPLGVLGGMIGLFIFVRFCFGGSDFTSIAGDSASPHFRRI